MHFRFSSSFYACIDRVLLLISQRVNSKCFYLCICLKNNNKIQEWRNKRDVAAAEATEATEATEASIPDILQCNNFSIIVRLRLMLDWEKKKVEEAGKSTYARASAGQIADFECVTFSRNVVYEHQEKSPGVALDRATNFSSSCLLYLY